MIPILFPSFLYVMNYHLFCGNTKYKRHNTFYFNPAIRPQDPNTYAVLVAP